jgi:hypothetical protein
MISITKFPFRVLVPVGLGVVATASLFMAVRAYAAGIPDADVLTYTGYLEDGDGAALTGSYSIDVTFWGSVDGNDDLCTGGDDNAQLQSGRFQIALPDCVDVVKANQNLWVDVQVDGASLGRTKLGAVPFAVEAGHATSATNADQSASASAADGALDDRIGAIEAAAPGDSGFRAISSAGATIHHGSPRTYTIWDTEVFDLADEFDPATDTFTTKDGGYYEISCTLFYVTVAGSYFMETGIVLNDLGLADADNSLNTGITHQPIRANTLLKLQPGDEITCGAWQNSGGNMSIRAHASFPNESPSWFTAVRIKPL